MVDVRVRHTSSVVLVAVVLAGLVTALVLSFVLEDDPAPAPDDALTLDPDNTGTIDAVDLRGTPAPDFAYEPLSGGEVLFQEVRDGRPAVINFFARSCVPCVREMPALEAAFQEHRGQVAFFGLSERESVEDAMELVERTGVTYDIGRDPDGAIIAAFEGFGLPTTVFVAADGTITASYTGEIEADELQGEIEALLA
jgi:cytochrome c biogenesis protein CcmG, thiol:disulfide interchange protein DsbE